MASTSPVPTTSLKSQKGHPGNNNNKLGKNQYKDRPLPDDPHVAELLQAYHRKGISDRKQVSKLLLEEHGIILSESSISRRKRKLGLRASHLTTLELSEDLKIQLILDQMAKDPTGRIGPRTVKQGILKETGVQLTRDYIREEMRKLDPVSYSARGPAHVKAKRQQRLAEQEASTSGSMQPPIHDSSIPPLSQSHTLSLPLEAHPMARLPAPANHSQHGFSDSYRIVPQPLDPLPIEMDEDPDEPEGGPYDNCYDPRPPYPSSIDHQTQHPTQFHVVDPHITTSPHPTSTSQAMLTAISFLQDATPKMETLTRFLNTVDADNEELDTEAYDLVVKGMESAALLERQLSRIISRAQFGRP